MQNRPNTATIRRHDEKMLRKFRVSVSRKALEQVTVLRTVSRLGLFHALTLAVFFLSGLVPANTEFVYADSLDQLEITFDVENTNDVINIDNINAGTDDDGPVFIEVGNESHVLPLASDASTFSPLQPVTETSLANAAYVAIVPNTTGGAQFVAPTSNIVLPQAYWSTPKVVANTSPPLGSTAVIAVPTSNGIQLAAWDGTTGVQTNGNPIRLASGMIDASSTSSLLETGSGTLFGSIPSGTPIVLLAQSGTPEYSPVGGLSPATNPTPAGANYTGPYTSPNTSYSAAQSPYDPNYRSSLSQQYDQMMSFMNNITFHALWMPDSGSKPLGNTELRAQARFAIPCRMLGDSMFYVAPAFQVNFWEAEFKSSQYRYKMSDTTFGAWLDAGIEPTLGTEFRFDIWGSVGVYTDFKKIKSDSIYVRGRGRGYYQYSNNLELMAGVIYMNREHIRLMPTFGLIWTPSQFLECHLIFPDPKIARYIHTTNDTEWWAYVRGDYGGGSWAVNTDYGVLKTDYNDIRIALGIEFRNKPKQCLSGHFEVGGAFNRELYANGHSWYKPSSCVFLAGGLRY